MKALESSMVWISNCHINWRQLASQGMNIHLLKHTASSSGNHNLQLS